MARSHILKGFSDIEAALWVHKYNKNGYLNINQMVKQATNNGFIIIDKARFEAVQLLNEWGLADKPTRSLTHKGDSFYTLWQIKPNVAIDVLHGLQYTLWTQKNPSANIASWAYKIICDYIWEREILPEKDELIRYVDNMREINKDIIPPDIGNAFSDKSINDAYDWILPLDPPILIGVEGLEVKQYRNAKVERRGFCSSALFIMALAYLMRESNTKLGDLFKIDDIRKRKICSCCFIKEDSFDLMLDNTLRMFPYVSIQKEWELYLILKREPQIEDFLG